MYKKFYRVIFEAKDGDKYAEFYKAINIFNLVKCIEKEKPFHVVEIKEYKTRPKAYEGERVEPNTITEI